MAKQSIPLAPGEALFLYLLRNDMSITLLARTVGVQSPTMSDILWGRVNPNNQMADAIRKATDGGVDLRRWTDGVCLASVDPGEHLIILMRRNGMSTADFCRKHSLNETRISRIIRGRISPSDSEREAIEKQFKDLKNAWRKCL